LCANYESQEQIGISDCYNVTQMFQTLNRANDKSLMIDIGKKKEKKRD
jgi:hypothetical protein